MFRAATLSKRSFIEEAVKCLSSASQCRTFNQNVLDCQWAMTSRTLRMISA